MSSSNNSGEKFLGFIIVGACIIAGMWLLEIGPFEKSYTPTPTYYNNYGGGSQPSFGGNSSSSWKANAYYGDGSFAYKITVYDDYIVTPSGGKYKYYSTTGTGNTSYAYFVDMGTFFIYF